MHKSDNSTYRISLKKTTTAQVVQPLVTVKNSPIQDYTNQDDHIPPNYIRIHVSTVILQVRSRPSAGI